jgi:hypothetical protein
MHQAGDGVVKGQQVVAEAPVDLDGRAAAVLAAELVLLGGIPASSVPRPRRVECCMRHTCVVQAIAAGGCHAHKQPAQQPAAC